ncbi:serine/threonine-protein kinase [Laspinema olomoucense]|uniref:serine/threonine-protein kinase n=1 Tax=Laspinema olomoucense TaxID=3231600 RepID=UPI0021BBB26E|nr:serine/threonine-protein kinase [Laspinema sp. D3d]MCT7972586.1 serine/threonine protein kinase [Laspinema sp. D3d]
MNKLTLLNNRYRIIKELGSGGFGETFLSEDTQMPSERRCVVKQLKPVTANPQIFQLINERFAREAAILEALGEGNRQIPRLYAYFEEQSQFYLVQEWIEGETLTNRVENQGKMSESSVREILISLLPVLEFVHSQRIVHRDIKPDNIMLRKSDGIPILIDFGAVKETMGTVMNSSGNGTSSIVIGTPGFMPSEQAAGRPVYSSDLYSLGLTAIYLLTEKWPQELAINHDTGEVIWRQYAPRISPSLATVLDKAIMSHSRDRFHSAREMLDALEGRNSSFPALGITSVPPVASGVPVTAVSTPTTHYQQQGVVSPSTVQPVDKSGGMRDWQKAAIMGAVVGVIIIVASAIAGLFFSDRNVILFDQASTFQPQGGSTSKQSLGWIRIGSVNNRINTASVGDPLIRTNQPVMISPPVVPEMGANVTISNSVRLRRNHPQPPDYKLQEEISVLMPGQQVTILNLKTFIDPLSRSPETKVWAEVGLP